MSTIVTQVTKTQRRRRRNRNTPVVTTTQVARPRRRRNRGSRNITGNSTFLSSYVNTLNDPFDFPPPKLGFGTFQSTTVATAYLHGTVTVNATDGSVALFMAPDITKMLYYNAGGASTNTWSSTSAQNSNVLQQIGETYRVISGGIRTCPLVATTSTPGQVFCVNTNGFTPNQLTSFTPAQIGAWPGAHLGLATYGASWLSRPVSGENLTNFYYSTFGYAGTVIQPDAQGVVYYFGLPAGTNVLYELILNIEISNQGQSSTAIRSPELEVIDTGKYITPEILVRDAFPYIIPAVNLDFREGGPSTNGFNLGTLHLAGVRTGSSRNGRLAMSRSMAMTLGQTNGPGSIRNLRSMSRNTPIPEYNRETEQFEERLRASGQSITDPDYISVVGNSGLSGVAAAIGTNVVSSMLRRGLGA